MAVAEREAALREAHRVVIRADRLRALRGLGSSEQADLREDEVHEDRGRITYKSYYLY
ncbi:hypothetical protein [Streptomyces rubradiris]|uniref:Uncharacterized protein n=1 Tax=Streptomyces rubradiris TaxID=285531 RepID=A0ABQ3RAQ2_STRRR|nr:hypothetical protein [Streptomyces rubradiris]GHH18684.1 hypothetical protein GCM10018792_50680 [Streptomyces rubradiris]GHI52934.1 hypothetical protein Srubr_27800 [Streptomyces rubradiris]